MDEDDMQELYKWIDSVQLSRPKRNISRDFSDGVLVAEVVKNFAPRLVELHNYQPASSQKQKLENWKTLNRKVLNRIDLTVPGNVLQGVVMMKPGVIEVVLNNLRLKLQQYLSPPRYDGGEQLVSIAPTVGRSPRSAGRKAVYNTTEKLPAIAPRSGSESERSRGGAQGGGSSRRKQGGGREPPRGLGPGPAANADPYVMLAEKEAEMLDQQETIEILQVKIEKLTQLVHLKDRRIKDLQRNLEGPG